MRFGTVSPKPRQRKLTRQFLGAVERLAQVWPDMLPHTEARQAADIGRHCCGSENTFTVVAKLEPELPKTRQPICVRPGMSTESGSSLLSSIPKQADANDGSWHRTALLFVRHRDNSARAHVRSDEVLPILTKRTFVSIGSRLNCCGAYRATGSATNLSFVMSGLIRYLTVLRPTPMS